jgi:hypothetical protein
MASAKNPPADESLPAPTVRTIVSLLLFIHLFCVVLSLTSNLVRSTLQSRVLRVLAPYTDLLNINLDFTPYYLTHGPQITVDDRIELLPEGKDPQNPEDWLVLPDVGSKAGERYKRYQRLATLMAMRSQDDVVSTIASDVAQNTIVQSKVPLSKVRIRRHMLMYPRAYPPRDRRQPDNAFHPDLFQTSYTANVVFDEDLGKASVVKQTEAKGHSAPSADGTSTPSTATPSAVKQP